METVEAGRNGVLVPPRDPRRLAEAILGLLNAPATAVAMAAESRRIAEERYEIGQVTEGLLRFFWSAVGSKGSHPPSPAASGGTG